jgi:hypothetical protein
VVAPQQVVEAVARGFSIDENSMAISRTAPEDFLLRLPSLATADQVFNSGAPFQGPRFTLFFKRWTRLVGAEAAVLPVSVEVEFRGILAHAWERSTAQQLLGGAGWVQQVHDDTATRRDLSVFRVSAWCLHMNLLPTVGKLFIPDPSPIGGSCCQQRVASSTPSESPGRPLQEGRRLLLLRRSPGRHLGDVGDVVVVPRPAALRPFPSGLRCGPRWAPWLPMWHKPHAIPISPTRRHAHSMKAPQKFNLRLSFCHLLTQCCIHAMARVPWKLLQDMTPRPARLLPRKHGRYALRRQRWTGSMRPPRGVAQHPLPSQR